MSVAGGDRVNGRLGPQGIEGGDQPAGSEGRRSAIESLAQLRCSSLGWNSLLIRRQGRDKVVGRNDGRVQVGGQRVERRLLGEDSRDGRTPRNVSGAEQERVSTGVDLELVPLAGKTVEDRCPSASKRFERVKG